MNIKRILPFIPVFALNIFSLIVMVKVLTGQIGNFETWRVAAAVAGFLITFVFNLLIILHLRKLKNK